MASNDNQRMNAMGSNIRRLIGSDANRSHLQALPAFRVEKTLPPRLVVLLDRLEQAEDRQQERRH